MFMTVFIQVPSDADLRSNLKEGHYFFAELPGDVVGSRVRLIHRVQEVGGCGVWLPCFCCGVSRDSTIG